MMKDFIHSILAYVKAFQLIVKLRLWFYVLIPGIFSVFFGGLVLLLAWNFSDNLGDWITSWYGGKGEGIIETIGTVFSGVTMILLTLLLFKYIILIVVSPFMSPLADRIEKYLTNKTIPAPFHMGKIIKDLVRGLRLSARNIFWELSLTVLLLLGSFIFPPIAPFIAILIFLIQSYYAGFGNMDFTMERHFDFKESIQFVRNHRGLAIGNGVIFLGILLTGIGFLFAPPLATVAAAVETVKRLEK